MGIGALFFFVILAVASVWTLIVTENRDHLKVVGVITAALWLFFLWWYRPWFHGILLPILHIGLALTLILSALITLAIVLGLKGQKALAILFAIAAVVFFIWPTCFSGEFYMKILCKNTAYEKTGTLPQIKKTRLLPLSVAERFAEDSFQESREKLGDYSIVNNDGKLVWQAPRVPDGGIIYFSNKMGGVVEISTESSEKTTYSIEKKSYGMEVSEGVGIEDSIYFRLYKERYWIHIPDGIYYLKDAEKDQQVAIVPFVEYKWSFPTRYPVFGGVFLVYDDGDIVELSPEDCDKSVLLRGNVYYPEWLQRKEVEAYAYYKGILNKLFKHKDQIEVADVLEGGNPQPYLLMSEGGPTWFTAAEPYGKAFGILKIFTRSACLSKEPIKILEYSKDSVLTGPKRITGYVRSSRNVTVPDWRSYGIIETRPAPINNVLYWQLSIVPYSEGPNGAVDKTKSFTGVYATIYVNAKTNEVYAFKNDVNAVKFVQGSWNMNVKNDFDMVSYSPVDTDAGGGVKTGPIERIDRLINELQQLKQELMNQ